LPSSRRNSPASSRPPGLTTARIGTRSARRTRVCGAAGSRRFSPRDRKRHAPPAAADTPRQRGSDDQPCVQSARLQRLLKFNAAHFIAYHGFREALHGHNYRVSVDVEGDSAPMDTCRLRRREGRGATSVQTARREDVDPGAERLPGDPRGRRAGRRPLRQRRIRDPKSDVLLVPIVHSSAEELARYSPARCAANWMTTVCAACAPLKSVSKKHRAGRLLSRGLVTVRRVLASVALLLGLAACQKPLPRPTPRWPLYAARCGSCHRAFQPRRSSTHVGDPGRSQAECHGACRQPPLTTRSAPWC